MADQVQCPSCGGFKVKEQKVESVWNKVPLSSADRRKYLTSLLGLTFVCIFVAIAIGIIGVSSRDTDWPCMEIPFLGLVLIALGSIVISLFQNTKKKLKGKIYYYYCYICGYRWSWETGTPKPRVNVNQELITKGSQRLEEEEEERQRAAAAWYLHQQQQKKK